MTAEVFYLHRRILTEHIWRYKVVLMRRDPFRDLRRMDEAMYRLWRGVSDEGTRQIKRWAVPLDIVAEDDNVVVRATMPGIAPDDITVTVDEGVLTIEGETKEERKDNYLMRRTKMLWSTPSTFILYRPDVL